MNTSNGITYIDPPKRVSISQWSVEGFGRVAAAKRTENRSDVDIYAYADELSAQREVEKLAKKNGDVCLLNVSDGDLGGLR